MKLTIKIRNETENFLLVFINEDENGFSYVYSFSNENTYKNFLKNRTVKRIFYIDDNADAKKHIKNNLAEFNLLIEQTMPIYEINSLDDILETENVILDISNLAWQDKLYIINNLATNKTFFKDRYTLNEILILNDIQCMYMIIEDLVRPLKIKSPLEQLYSIYTLLKERPYYNDNNEDINTTRSLNQILYTNPIVCAGYANFFKAMCDALDIRVEYLHWDKNDSSHVDNICYVNDSKYDIVGIFAMDITFDVESNRILHFLYPMNKETREKTLGGYVVDEQNIYYNLLSRYKDYLYYIEKKYPSFIIDNQKQRIIRIINQIYELLKLNYKINEQCNIDEEIKKIKKYANVYISPFTLRKIIDIADLEYSLEVIKTSFHYKALTPEDKLMVDVLWNCNRKL